MTAHKGRYWLAFEGANEVWRYSPPAGSARFRRACPR
jgi:hypothetical protein